MTVTIHAIYESGVFRPMEPVELPEGCEVEFEPRIVENGAPSNQDLDRVYEIMGQRYASGEHDVAERHNEHQP